MSPIDQPTRHRLFGLSVQSEQPLGTVPIQTGAADDLLGSLEIRLENGAPKGNWNKLFSVDEPPNFLTIDKRAACYRLRFFEQHDFVFDPDAMVVTCFVGETPWPVLEQILVDQVLPRVAQSLGALAIHASAVLLDESIVGFLGDSGAGKSTVCSEFMTRGYPLVCDDCLTVTRHSAAGRLGSHKLLAWPGYNSVRLWPDSAARIADDLPFATPRTTKRRWEGALVDRPHPVGALFLLEPSDDDLPEPQCSRVRGAEGLKQLASCLHRLEPERRELLQAEFATMHDLLAEADFYRIAYTQTDKAAGEIAAMVEGLLGGSGS